MFTRTQVQELERRPQTTPPATRFPGKQLSWPTQTLAVVTLKTANQRKPRRCRQRLGASIPEISTSQGFCEFPLLQTLAREPKLLFHNQVFS